MVVVVVEGREHNASMRVSQMLHKAKLRPLIASADVQIGPRLGRRLQSFVLFLCLQTQSKTNAFYRECQHSAKSTMFSTAYKTRLFVSTKAKQQYLLQD